MGFSIYLKWVDTLADILLVTQRLLSCVLLLCVLLLCFVFCVLCFVLSFPASLWLAESLWWRLGFTL